MNRSLISNNMENSNKVLLGMSGGVDSSAAALKLLNEGYEVAGATMILKPLEYLSEDEKDNLYKECEDARKVCDILGIPHYAPNFQKEFKEAVIKDFINAYLEGRTPNPCVQCNINLKFGAMLEFAKANGFGKIATGHYAKLEYDGEKNRTLLKKAPSNKDQSYFLYGLNSEQLSRSIFPIGCMEKADARALAEKYKLPVAKKPDSQEICFIKNNNYVDFLTNYAPSLPKEGNFVNTENKIIGKHQGIHRYTIGQRKGLGVTFGEPMYVSKINAANNTVTLSRLEGLFTESLFIRDVNLIAVESSSFPIYADVKIRYQAKPQKALIEKTENSGILKITFEEKQKSVTPGQSAVFYSGDTVLGGGTII